MLLRNLTLILSMSANVFLALQLHGSKSLDVRIQQAFAEQIPQVASRAFSDGCEAALGAFTRRTPEDTDYVLYQDWCGTNGKIYGKKK